MVLSSRNVNHHDNLKGYHVVHLNSIRLSELAVIISTIFRTSSSSATEIQNERNAVLYHTRRAIKIVILWCSVAVLDMYRTALRGLLFNLDFTARKVNEILRDPVNEIDT